MDNKIVKFEDVKAAQNRINAYIEQTPLLNIGEGVYLKAEHLQVTKSFKPRGACNAMLQLTEGERKKGVITRSSGNFAQAISYMGKKLGVDVTVVMPEHVPLVKKKATESHGAKVLLRGHQHAEAQALVDEIADRDGLKPMHPFDSNNVIAGQGTAMLEICEQVKKVDVYFCPISGGGLMAGTSLVLKAMNPKAKVIGVEPEGAADYAAYRKTGQKDVLRKAASVADGLLAPFVGKHCLPLLDAYVDEVITLSEEEILAATKALHNMGHMVEPSGAAAYAGYIKGLVETKGKTVVCMASGGNFDATIPE